MRNSSRVRQYQIFNKPRNHWEAILISKLYCLCETTKASAPRVLTQWLAKQPLLIWLLIWFKDPVSILGAILEAHRHPTAWPAAHAGPSLALLWEDSQLLRCCENSLEACRQTQVGSGQSFVCLMGKKSSPIAIFSAMSSVSLVWTSHS